MTSSNRSPRSLTGCQRPTSEVVPAYVGSDIDRCIAYCSLGDLEFFDWQDHVLEGWLGRNAAGKWAARICGLLGPRQNGKTLGIIGGRVLYGMGVLGEVVVYTAQIQKTSTETFEELAAFFDKPKTRRHLKKVNEAIGRERIQLKNGADMKFLARTSKGGRGQHGDLIIFDEAQYLTGSQQGSFIYSKAARPNPQTIYLGTPPDEECEGRVFGNIRQRALSGKTKTTAWAEWAVDEVGDVSDEARWARTNPSYGVLISPETVREELEQSETDEGFARERMCYWPAKVIKTEPALDVVAWEACASAEPAREGAVSYGIKFSLDGSQAALAACIRPEKGKPHIEVVCVRSCERGVGWFTRWLKRRQGAFAVVKIDGKAKAGALEQDLIEARLPKPYFDVISAADITLACSMLDDAVSARSVTHFDQPGLNDAARMCPKRLVGKAGGWAFDDAEDVSPIALEACALAYMGAMTTKNKPGKGCRLL